MNWTQYLTHLLDQLGEVKAKGESLEALNTIYTEVEATRNALIEEEEDEGESVVIH